MRWLSTRSGHDLTDEIAQRGGPLVVHRHRVGADGTALEAEAGERAPQLREHRRPQVDRPVDAEAVVGAIAVPSRVCSAVSSGVEAVVGAIAVPSRVCSTVAESSVTGAGLAVTWVPDDGAPRGAGVLGAGV